MFEKEKITTFDASDPIVKRLRNAYLNRERTEYGRVLWFKYWDDNGTVKVDVCSIWLIGEYIQVAHQPTPRLREAGVWRPIKDSPFHKRMLDRGYFPDIHRSES